MKRMTASRIDSISHVYGRQHIDDNLYFEVRKTGRPSWLFRFVAPTGRRRDMSLGSYPSVTLAGARELASKWRGVVASGEDPIEVRNASREQRRP
ncbi:MAG: Arm DNA-binding domain-containing protein [Pseudomonadota bacterium]|nr:Arm DNA-binding domain-containing protein [Pseudomonadota bacterium]